jgi:hypothetical protein
MRGRTGGPAIPDQPEQATGEGIMSRKSWKSEDIENQNHIFVLAKVSKSCFEYMNR